VVITAVATSDVPITDRVRDGVDLSRQVAQAFDDFLL
jgi:hypothetical protein